MFNEGDVIVGVTDVGSRKKSRRKKKDGVDFSDDDDEDGGSDEEGFDSEGEYGSGGDEDDEDGNESDELILDDEEKGTKREKNAQSKRNRIRTHTNIFRVCAVYWGNKAYVNMMVDGAAAKVPSSVAADKNCFVVCRLLKAG